MAANEQFEGSGSDEAIAELWTALEEYERFLGALESGRSGRDGGIDVDARLAEDPGQGATDASPTTAVAASDDVGGNGFRAQSSLRADPDHPDHTDDAHVEPSIPEPSGPVLLDAEIELPEAGIPLADRSVELPEPSREPMPSLYAQPPLDLRRRPAPTTESPGWRPVPAAESPGWRPAPRPGAQAPTDTARPAVGPGTSHHEAASPDGPRAEPDIAPRPAGVAVSSMTKPTTDDDRARARSDEPDESDDEPPRRRTGASMGIWGARAAGRSESSRPFLRELPVLLLIALVLAFLLRTFVVQVFYIPSSSMELTLNINDRMVVEKVTYRFRAPRHGEIIVFAGPELGQPPADAAAFDRTVRNVGQFLGVVPASARDYVKRVIGLPGDEVVLADGTVFVNDVRLDEPYVAFTDADDFGPVTVPDGQLFVLGDNRPNSSDSRRSLGFVAEDDVVGRAAVIIWPPGNTGLLTRDRHELAAGWDAVAAAP